MPGRQIEKSEVNQKKEVLSRMFPAEAEKSYTKEKSLYPQISN